MKDRNGITWDLISFFPEFNGLKMQKFKSNLDNDITELKHKSENLDVLSSKNSIKWVSILITMEYTVSRLGHLSAYLSCLEAANSDNEDYAVEQAALVRLCAAYEKVEIDIQNVLKNTPDDVFNSFCENSGLKDITHYLERLKEQATHTMSRKEEALASDLNIDGLSAWGRLYDKVTGKLEFDFVTKEGHVERRPISQWRSLMSNPDRDVGHAAFEGGNRAWQNIEDVCGAALNAIAGNRLTLYRHRRLPHFMDQALFDAVISSETLEAMYQAVFKNLDLARDILRHKARFFGRKGIWFFEREAPLPLTGATALDWAQAAELVHNAFHKSYPALADYFQKMLKMRWIESEARPNKRPGAFCTGSSLIGEQRVYMTFNGTLGDVSTLAHEVGHAWHDHLLKDSRPFARRYPMTLAETASIFAEHLLIEGLHGDSRLDNRHKLALLDSELMDAAIFMLDITTRYKFEKTFHEERQKGEVPVSKLKSMMSETQRELYGDALLPNGEDPYFWASKLHFYITDTAFYNFPYTFGYLLARALFHRYRSSGADFIPEYESFLRISGSGTVEDVSRRALRIDLTDASFWAQSIRSLEDPLERYRKEITRELKR